MTKEITNFVHYVIAAMLTSVYAIMIVGVLLWVFKVDNKDQIISVLGMLALLSEVIAGIVGRIKDKKEGC